ncbi:MAG: hypothetical protein LBE34_12855 [Flavobacteriaceae bacterium]|jgi:hypothetical protein|nr:hypothetical protein [Flavobacteriaceae bacterium]
MDRLLLLFFGLSFLCTNGQNYNSVYAPSKSSNNNLSETIRQQEQLNLQNKEQRKRKEEFEYNKKLDAKKHNYSDNNMIITDNYKREYFLNALKKGAPHIAFGFEDDYFIYPTVKDVSDLFKNTEDIQKAAFVSSLTQLLENIEYVKSYKNTFKNELHIKGVIFRTNTIINYETRRYYFQFTINEIEGFPDFMDMKEIVDYITENNMENIIYIKNSSK